MAPPSARADDRPYFSHANHVVSGIDCVDCHTSAKESLPGPDFASCLNCHDERPQYRPYARARRLTMSFEHELHAGMLECTECHESIAKQNRPSSEEIAAADAAGTSAAPPKVTAAMFRPPQCFTCHDSKAVAVRRTDCVSCHGPKISEKAPSSHNPTWVTEHGPTMKSEGEPAGEISDGQIKACGQCHHGADPCMTCHQEKKAMFHSRHLKDRGAECGDCHGKMKDCGFPGVDAEACGTCHDGRVQQTLIAARGRRLAAAFPHTKHVDKVECNECHSATTSDTQKASVPLVPQTTCVACHRESKVVIGESQCRPCHGNDRARIAPEDHGEKQVWMARHGRASESRLEFQHGLTCSQCHAQVACVNCHSTRAPQSHTGLWRARLHGIVAPWEPERCRTCHEPGACIRCHENNKPLNHTGSWRSVHALAAQVRTNESCGACHAAGWCASCHRGERQ